MLRYAVAWVALAFFVLSCFAPWVTVTTYANAIEYHGALEEAFFGGIYLLALAGLAALGLLARRPALTVTCAVLACVLTAFLGSQAPGAMMDLAVAPPGRTRLAPDFTSTEDSKKCGRRRQDAAARTRRQPQLKQRARVTWSNMPFFSIVIATPFPNPVRWQ